MKLTRKQLVKRIDSKYNPCVTGAMAVAVAIGLYFDVSLMTSFWQYMFFLALKTGLKYGA